MFSLSFLYHIYDMTLKLFGSFFDILVVIFYKIIYERDGPRIVGLSERHNERENLILGGDSYNSSDNHII